MFVSRIISALPFKGAFSKLGISRYLSYLCGSLYIKVFSLWLLVVLLSTIGCVRFAHRRLWLTGITNDKLIEQYNDFAIRSAKANLWNEAILRWQRIIEIDPKNAKAHNNLGVAYEATERFDEALVEYNKAIELDPGNAAYQSNFFNCQKNKGRSWHTERNGEKK